MTIRDEQLKWEVIANLPQDRQQEIRLLILFSAGVRFGVHMGFVVPMMGQLWYPRVADFLIRCPSGPENLEVADEQEEQLVDETVVAMLRCCDCSASAGKSFHYLDVWNLVQVAGAVVLRQMRLRATSAPRALASAHYWNDRDVARTQLLIRWMQVLRISNPKFVTLMNEVGFAQAWEQNTSSLVEQTLAQCNTEDSALADSARQAWDGFCPDSRAAIASAAKWVAAKKRGS